MQLWRILDRAEFGKRADVDAELGECRARVLEEARERRMIGAIEFREPLIHECVIGVEKVEDAALLANDVHEVSLRLMHHVAPQSYMK